MKKFVTSLFCLMAFFCTKAQTIYTIGYDKIDIEVVNPYFFAEMIYPGQPSACGIYDKTSETFYTCDYQTFRYVEDEFVQYTGKACCEKVDFDPAKYYGTLTLKGVIDSVEWDNLIIHFTTDKARLTIKTDEREIDALYDKYFKENHLGKVNIIFKFKTYDSPTEAQISYNKNMEHKRKPTRVYTKVLRW
ncbi:MAG: hypothetical protein JNJ58_08295 [Chitinophagaceae bacterium]|nr:hypothetical protein [Chitinophagaceae bacterium]